MMNLETRKDATAFFEGLGEYFEKNTKFSENHIRRNSFDEKNERLGGLAISLFPKGIKDLLFTDLSDSIFTFHIQFWNLWKDNKTKRVFMFNLWAGDNAEKAKDFNAKKHLFSNKKSDTNSGQAYNVMNKENYVDINSTSIPQKLRSVPNEVDETILYPLIADTVEKMYDDFYPELAKLFGVEVNINSELKNRCNEFKLLYSEVQTTDYYRTRIKQIEQFVPLAKDIIIQTLNKQNNITEDFTGFIQMFKFGTKQPTFQNYLEKIFLDSDVDIQHYTNRFDESVSGYTGAGAATIRATLSETQLTEITKILQQAIQAKNQEDAIRIAGLFDDLNAPYIKDGIYSPWLYYLNPTVFPIKNGSITPFLSDFGIKKDYKSVISAFYKIRDCIEVKDFGFVDTLAHHYGMNEDYRNLLHTLKKVGYENSIKFYTLADKLVEALSLEKGDNRIHYNSIPNDKLNITFGQRYVLSCIVNDAEPFGFIFPNEQVLTLGVRLADSFKGNPTAKYYKTASSDLINEHFESILNACKSELSRTEKSGYRGRSTNLRFEESIFDKDFRETVFAEVFEENEVKTVTPKTENHNLKNIHPLNQILYGPPGTGKTYHTINKALAIIDNEEERVYKDTDRTELKTRFDALSESGQIGFVTFHQSMSYEDFVEGIKPKLHGGTSEKVEFELKSGIFKKMADRAKENPQTPYVLIIDEINRGNVAGIFGELITLIEDDKRIGKPEELRVTLPYSKKPFGVPANLHLIGTMNTADRSVEALDTALRRRFVFDEMLPKPELLENKKIEGINLTELLTTINARLEKLLDRDHLIGHAYLWNIIEINHLRHAFYNKIIPQLQEYFYRDYVKIGLVLGSGFVEKKSDKIEFAAFDKKEQDYSDFAEKPTYEIKQIKNDSDFIKAVTSIYDLKIKNTDDTDSKK